MYQKPQICCSVTFKHLLKVSGKRWILFRGPVSFLSTLPKFEQFVPQHESVTHKDMVEFCSFLQNKQKCLVLTGAGVSTESGIPDYRSEGVGLYASSKSRPVIYKDFLSDSKIRQRYWARNFTGWPTFSIKKPNLTHRSLKILEDHNFITGIVTQNVDSLHNKVGNLNVIELHGTAYRVVCLNCKYNVERHKFQENLMNLNPISVEEVESVNPDGDVTLPESSTSNFVVPSCPDCCGILKPDIVFFGDNVPRERVETIRELVRASDSIIVLGSSLTVYSSYRIILQAVELKKPVLIVNIGPTRADKLASIKLNVRCGEIFEKALQLIINN